jgi:hypothetical protein
MLGAVAGIALVEEAPDVHIEAGVVIEDIVTGPVGKRCL